MGRQHVNRGLLKSVCSPLAPVVQELQSTVRETLQEVVAKKKITSLNDGRTLILETSNNLFGGAWRLSLPI